MSERKIVRERAMEMVGERGNDKKERERGKK